MERKIGQDAKESQVVQPLLQLPANKPLDIRTDPSSEQPVLVAVEPSVCVGKKFGVAKGNRLDYANQASPPIVAVDAASTSTYESNLYKRIPISVSVMNPVPASLPSSRLLWFPLLSSSAPQKIHAHTPKSTCVSVLNPVAASPPSSRLLWSPLLASSASQSQNISARSWTEVAPPSLSSSSTCHRLPEDVIHGQNDAKESKAKHRAADKAEAQAAAASAVGYIVQRASGKGEALRSQNTNEIKKIDSSEALGFAAAITHDLVSAAVDTSEASEANVKKRSAALATAGIMVGAAAATGVALGTAAAVVLAGDAAPEGGAKDGTQEKKAEDNPMQMEGGEEVQEEAPNAEPAEIPEPASAQPGASSAAPTLEEKAEKQSCEEGEDYKKSVAKVAAVGETRIDVKEEENDVKEEENAEKKDDAEESKTCCKRFCSCLYGFCCWPCICIFFCGACALGCCGNCMSCIKAIIRAFGDCVRAAVRIFAGCLEYVWVAVCDCNTSAEDKAGLALKMRHEAHEAADEMGHLAEEVKGN
mmetsp:Transcript_21966/g.41134  ORF Transcript_21966/g.41134 Transcript_21966/m.41134 type:complete len:531 (-) Transcript_21966:289-1881(-)|eukprot:CAMPEP_0170186252 /NCGR_PEP_ID=MMETSP0040_2-20121228/38607_1 /TAXON_ID=641309 /ORGANISM="Lotharella oceanica, Strain CCMP622" /LENGTH=530 /DNA_ID=CAMNT_0010432921 /DNA_START=69 /DNA_END=1661 /DNA_ORIENTATION=-